MKFTALLQDSAAIDTFIRVLTSASRLAKKRCCVKIDKSSMNFISCSSLTDANSNTWFNVAIPFSSQLFRKFDMVGMNQRNGELDKIYFELEMDSLIGVLPGGHCYLKLKLSKNMNDEPILSVEVRNPEADIVSNQIPITIILTKYWSSYARPSIGLRKIAICMPPPKIVGRFMHAFKNMNAKVVTFTANQSGDFRISTHVEHGEVDASFSDLQTTGSDSQEDTVKVQLLLKSITSLFQTISHLKARVKMDIISNRMAEFNVHSEDCDLSFIVGCV